MDPLSDVLSLLKVSSSLSTRCEGRGRWALRFPNYEHIKFGGVLGGSGYLWMEGVAPVRLEAGDFYLLTGGKPFCTGTDLKRALQDGQEMMRSNRGADGVARFDTRPHAHGASADDEHFVSFASGRFTFENDDADLLLRHLPPLIHLRASDAQVQSLAALLNLLRWETSEPLPGAAIAGTSLATLVLIQALRVFLANTPQPEGWLSAMADARIGAALSAMHGDVARRWTVESLARVAGMSRTAFAARFKLLAGVTPLDYLNTWRMTLARKALRGGDKPIVTIAEGIGYQSDTAFSSAFRKATGQSPAQFRRLSQPACA